MAQLGMWQGVVDAGKLEQEGEGAEKVPPKTLTGVMAFLLWSVRPTLVHDLGGGWCESPVFWELTAVLLFPVYHNTNRRSAYWTKSVSIQNKILIPMYWFKSWIFGRDISGF